MAVIQRHCRFLAMGTREWVLACHCRKPQCVHCIVCLASPRLPLPWQNQIHTTDPSCKGVGSQPLWLRRIEEVEVEPPTVSTLGPIFVKCVSDCLACCNKILQAGCLKQWKRISSDFQGLGSPRSCCWGFVSGGDSSRLLDSNLTWPFAELEERVAEISYEAAKPILRVPAS